MVKLTVQRTIFFLCLWMLLHLFLRTQILIDPGSLWHVRVGEQIQKHGFYFSEPFTWYYANNEWIPQQWLAEYLFAIGQHLGGYELLVQIVFVAFAWLGSGLFVQYRNSGMNPLLAGMIVLFEMAAISFHVFLRPHLLSILFFGILIYWLDRQDRLGFRWFSWLKLSFLVIFWLNCHGGVLGGLVTIDLMVVFWIFRYLLSSKNEEQNEPASVKSNSFYFSSKNILQHLLLLGFLHSLVLLNPYGIRLASAWWKIVGSTDITEYIVEHQPLDFTKSGGVSLVFFAVFYIFILLGVPRSQWRAISFIPIIWFILTLKSIRHGPLFCAAAAVCLIDLIPLSRWYHWLKRHGDYLITDPLQNSISNSCHVKKTRWLVPIPIIAFLIIALTIVCQRNGIACPFLGKDWVQINSEVLPVDFIPTIQEYAQSRPKDFPIFNDPNLGGFLIYFAPTLKIYMDDRIELCEDKGLKEYLDIMKEPEKLELFWQKIENTPGAKLDRIFLFCKNPIRKYLDAHPEKYPILKETELAVLYERRINQKINRGPTE